MIGDTNCLGCMWLNTKTISIQNRPHFCCAWSRGLVALQKMCHSCFARGSMYHSCLPESKTFCSRTEHPSTSSKFRVLLKAHQLFCLFVWKHINSVHPHLNSGNVSDKWLIQYDFVSDLYQVSQYGADCITTASLWSGGEDHYL